jgi:tetratricopeptide (TPR) repeat protein
MDIKKPKKTVNILIALLIIVLFTLSCVLGGYAIGYKFFWQKFNTKPSLDREIVGYTAKVKQNPKDTETLNKLAWLGYQKNQDELAIQSCQQVLSLAPNDPNAHYVLGLVYLRKNQLDAAEKEFTFLYTNYPKNIRGLLGLAQTLLKEEQPDKAIPILLKLVELDKTLAEGHLYLGEAYYKRGEKNNAVDQFNEVLRFSPENSAAKDWIATISNNQSK